MIANQTFCEPETSDAELVALSLAGNRDAFGGIVARYQSLVCSLAYSATGDLGRSQYLAQATFVTAWKNLGLLREREKLRAWLCVIARRIIGRAVQTNTREATHAAESLDAVANHRAVELLPPETVISREEAAILWRSLERIPGTYREPLVLFYREYQSVEKVAEALELSPDAVKQRLLRGRKMLHEEVLAFVEGALNKSSPGRSFTIGVLSLLPLSAVSTASATSVGAGLAKGGAATVGFWLILGKSALGLASGFLGIFLGYKMCLAGVVGAEQRRLVRRFYAIVTAATLFSLGAALAIAFAHPSRTEGIFGVTMIAVMIGWIPATLSIIGNTRGALGTHLKLSGWASPAPAGYEYRVAPFPAIRAGSGSPIQTAYEYVLILCQSPKAKKKRSVELKNQQC